MKSLVLATALVLSGTALAQQAAVNDPQYQPNAGTIFGDTTYSQAHSTGFKGNLITQQIGYAFADNMSLAATLAHQNIERIEGLNDIKLDGKYRMRNGENRLDILAGLSISPDDSEIKSNGDENAYTGGHALRVGAEYGNRTTARTWSVFGLVHHNLKATENDKGAAVKTKYDAHQALELGAKLYTVLGENCGFLATAGAKFVGEYDNNQNGTTAGNSLYNLGGEYQHVVNNNLYLKGGFKAFIDGNGTNSNFMVYHVGAGYQF